MICHYLPIPLPALHTYLSTLPIYPSTLPIYPSPPTYPPTYPPTHLLISPPTHLPSEKFEQIVGELQLASEMATEGEDEYVRHPR